MRWLADLDEPTDDELRDAVVPKPTGFSGSKYATDVSGVRVTGTPAFIEAVAGLLKPLQAIENHRTRLTVSLQ